MKQIAADSPKIITRFVNAYNGCYKPLLLYITQPEEYEELTQLIRAALRESVPAFINYFQDDRFSEIPKEFEKYSKNVKRHHAQYMLTQVTWEKIICFRETEGLTLAPESQPTTSYAPCSSCLDDTIYIVLLT